jgi:hypothetical protein
MLHGAELLARVKELGEVTKAELVRGCGYASTGKDGRERLNMTAFYEALLEAKGVSLLGENGHSGRTLSYTAKVQGNGNLIIGKAYTGLSGAQVGEVYGIKVSRRQIRLLLQEPKEPAGAVTAPAAPAAPVVAATPSAPVTAPMVPTSDQAPLPPAPATPAPVAAAPAMLDQLVQAPMGTPVPRLYDPAVPLSPAA